FSPFKMSGSSDEESSTDELLMSDLYYDIVRIHSAGSFAAFGIIDAFVNPGISIDPIGIVRLPLSEEDALTLIHASQKAPFGKGTETLVDESVRKTWQIDAGKIQFLNPGWQRCLDKTVEHVARELGVAGGSKNVRAEFYKMLLYEKGAMFKPHQEYIISKNQRKNLANYWYSTERVPGMFGTLIICLPSRHTGGAVRLRHGAKSEIFDTSTNSAFDASFITWFIEPVLAGYRWVLTYNLINTSPTAYGSASALDARIGRLTQALTRWQNLDDGPEFLVYPFNHQYTDRNLKLALLKGDDYHRARHVAQSCAAHGEFYLLLANMEMCITDPNSDEQEGEQSVLSLFNIVDLQGLNLSIHDTRVISDRHLLHGSSYGDREPDVQRGGNYLGNHYAEIDQFFKDSASPFLY
ncbi:MAG: hypothetical protein Q9211_001042, partial [Gyalolechia sp. 1 TL-2023]